MHTVVRSCILCALVAFSPARAALEVAGTKFEPSAEVSGQQVVLNGAGLRTFVVVNVYAAGLYVQHRDATANGLIDQPGAKNVKLVLLRNLSADEFTHALIKGFTANQKPESLVKLQARLDEVKALMLSFGEAKKGWVVEISYLPGKGTRFILNGQQQGKDIAGEDFYQGMLMIWLGSHPVDSGLKRALLGSDNNS
jgi:hypothetical protein